MSSSGHGLCLSCGADEVVEVVYGYPSPEMIEQVEQGRAVLGGCILQPSEDINDLRLTCLACSWTRTSPGSFRSV